MNAITKIRFDFQMQNEDFARNLYGRWDRFFAKKIEKVIDEVLNQWEKKSFSSETELSTLDVQLSIDKLELNLGNISEEELDEQFPVKFRESLEDALNQWKKEKQERKTQKKSFSTEPNLSALTEADSTLNTQFLILFHFLLHGTLPWNATDEHKNINRLFLSVLRQNPKELRHFLQTYGHYTSLQQRLVYQLQDSQLERGIRLLEPGSENFIISYVKFLQVKYKNTEQPGITESNYRDTIWFVVYSYLLTNRSSYFDKKSFVTQTILQLAGKYNLNYDTLLKLMTSELEQQANKQTVSPELLQILSQLCREYTQKQYQEASIDAAIFYKTIYFSLQRKTSGKISPNSREALISILSKAGSCRTFLQHLKEEEIITLVPLVIHNESKFVVEVAHNLDIQKEQGELQGKAGGEFRLLKWQIIFPLLLENKGYSFNRKYFVESLFTKVAAQYNIDVLLLFDFFNKELQIGKLDKELKQIILQLTEKWQTKYSNNNEQAKDSIYTFLQQVLEQKVQLTPEQKEQIRELLAKDSTRKEIISRFDETGLSALVELLFPQEATLVLSFSEQLTIVLKQLKSTHRHHSGFALQKWNALFRSLQQPDFTLGKLISTLLEQAALFYQQAEFDILFALHQEEISYKLPYALKTTVSDWYEKEKDEQIKIVLKSTSEQEKYRLLDKLSSQHSEFLKTYLSALEESLASQELFAKDFPEAKWHILFDVLIGSQHARFDKQSCIQLSLTEIAARYGLSLQEMLTCFTQNFHRKQTKERQEIATIISRLTQQKPSQPISEPFKQTEKTFHLREQLKISGEKETALLEKLQQQTTFVQYIKPDILPTLIQLKNYLTDELKVTFDNRKLLELLLEIAKSYKTLSSVVILTRIIKHMMQQVPEDKKQIWMEKLETLSRTDKILSLVPDWQNTHIRNTRFADKTAHRTDKNENKKTYKTEETMNTETNPMYVNNAGIALISPFFLRLFSILELTENNQFKSIKEQAKAVYLLQYAESGKTDFPEHELMFNKFLAGLNISDAIPQNMELSQHEKETVDSMLKAVLQHWEKLKNTSLNGFQQAFLQRAGKLEERDDYYLLTVEEKTYDLLLDTLPWSFRMIKLPWMKKRLEVKWR